MLSPSYAFEGAMRPQPCYRPADLRPAYQLRYSWCGWPSTTPFPRDLLARVLPAVVPEWERDGLRILEAAVRAEQLQLTLSTTPRVAPVTLAARVKGRLQHHGRRHGIALDFSRKLAVRSVGDPTRAQVEAYVRNQVRKESLADERFRELLTSLTVVNPHVDLAQPTASHSGRYWYNLHLVLVASQRYRLGDMATLTRIRDTALRICAKKGYAASTVAVLPDHLHLALRGAITEAPEAIALAFLNNLAYALEQRAWWEGGYYAGTFGEYGMAAVRSTEGQA
jgi:REP element-mobilizing transposase RayT